MALAFYMDVHVPAAITAGLRRRGVDVLTSQEDETRQTDDELLLVRATELRRVLVTQDEDFLAIAAQWQSIGREFSGIAFAPQQGTSIGPYVDDLELLAVCCEPAEVANQVQHLPLR